MSATALAEANYARSVSAGEMFGRWVPVWPSGVETRVRSEIVYCWFALERGKAHGRGCLAEIHKRARRSCRAESGGSDCGGVVGSDGIGLISFELIEAGHHLVHDVNHCRLLAGWCLIVFYRSVDLCRWRGRDLVLRLRGHECRPRWSLRAGVQRLHCLQAVENLELCDDALMCVVHALPLALLKESHQELVSFAGCFESQFH